jgi:hypothetical protein
MKPDIELCVELLKALLKSPDYAHLGQPEDLSGFMHDFKLAEAYESQATRGKKGSLKLFGANSLAFKELVDESGIRARLAELDPLVPMAAMIVGLSKLEERYVKAAGRTSDALEALEGRVSRLDAALQGISAVQANVDLVSNRVEKLEAASSVLERAAGKQHRKMMAVAAFAFVLTMAMIVYGFYWGYRHGNPDISIDLDIGQLVGGTLLGTGALLAGGAYALATLRGLKDRG